MPEIRLDGINHMPSWNKNRKRCWQCLNGYTMFPVVNTIFGFVSIKIETVSKVITAQKMKFLIKDFFSKCDQIHSFLGI